MIKALLMQKNSRSLCIPFNIFLQAQIPSIIAIIMVEVLQNLCIMKKDIVQETLNISTLKSIA